MNIKAYERITERIIALLQQGTVPWHKPWRVKTHLPRNLITGKPYRGINVFLLMAMSYESPDWLTCRQANQLGGRIKKGEKACPVVFWKRVKTEDDESSDKPKKRPMLRLYHVFNMAQCDNLKSALTAEQNGSFQSIEPASLMAKMPAPPAIKHGMTMASYSPSEDCILMPDRQRFDGEEAYYATLFHELVHSTGHEKRLKRPGIVERNGYGSDPYCKEELVGELGSAFLCGYTGIVERTIDNSASYIEGWLKQLKDDRTLIVSAAAQAQKAADYILGRTFTESEATNG